MEKSYIESFFNKKRHEISIVDIESFFSEPQEETSVLEFKSGGVEIIDIYKEITAFLNTEGGLLIIGAPRESEKQIGKNKIKICQGELTYSNFKNKDWIYQKICSNIVPTPTNLKIEEFLTENGNVFLIEVPQSENPPHQSSADGKYYIRLERDAKPAPHGIIKALFDKRRVPKLVAELEYKSLEFAKDSIGVRIKNKSNVPADKVAFIVDVYNVERIYSRHTFEDTKESLINKFTLSNNSPNVLVQAITIPIDFEVIHYQRDYIVFIAYWCRDLDFRFNFYIISGKDKKVLEMGSYDEGPNFLDELDKLE